MKLGQITKCNSVIALRIGHVNIQRVKSFKLGPTWNIHKRQTRMNDHIIIIIWTIYDNLYSPISADRMTVEQKCPNKK